MKKPRFSDSKILQILKEAESDIPVPELCRKYGMSSASFYNWQPKHGGMQENVTLRDILCLRRRLRDLLTGLR